MADAPTEEETQRWHRRLASDANNRGWALAEKPSRTPAEDAEMLHAAHASRHLWSKIGTDKNFALADLLLGQVHALLGYERTAMPYAKSAFEYFTSRQSEPWEIAFSHAVLAHAAHAAGLGDVHRSNYVKAQEVADAMTDEEDRKVFDATFRVIPKPTPTQDAG